MNIYPRTTLSPVMKVSYGSGDKNNIPKANKVEKENLTEQERELQFYQDFTNECTKNKQHYEELKALAEKMKKGDILTAEEEQYLKTENPELYKEAEEIIKESKKYQKALEEAKTKEDVENVKVNTLAQYANELKLVVNNPYIPDGKKVEIAEKINKKVAIMAEQHAEFVKSEEFDKLPSELNANADGDLTAKQQNDMEEDNKQDDDGNDLKTLLVTDEKSAEENSN